MSDAPKLQSRARPRLLATMMGLAIIVALFGYDRWRTQANRALAEERLAAIVQADRRTGEPTADLALDQVHLMIDQASGYTFQARDGDVLEGGGASHTVELIVGGDVRLLVRVYLRDDGSRDGLEILGYLPAESGAIAPAP